MTRRSFPTIVRPGIALCAAALLVMTTLTHAQTPSALQEASDKIRQSLFPPGADEHDSARIRARLNTYWMVPLKERQTIYDAARNGDRRTGATAAQAAGLAAGLSAGNPLSPSGLTRGGNALAAVAALSMILPTRGSDAQPNISRIYLSRESPDGPLTRREDGWKQAVRTTESRLAEAAKALASTVRCETGCDGHVQLWRVASVDGKPARTVVWRRSPEINWSPADVARNAAMPFWPWFESPGQNGWVIELIEVERDSEGRPTMRDVEGTALPIPTESWARSPDGIRFLRALTASGHLVIGRRAQNFVAVQGHVYEVGELTADGFVGAELVP